MLPPPPAMVRLLSEDKYNNTIRKLVLRRDAAKRRIQEVFSKRLKALRNKALAQRRKAHRRVNKKLLEVKKIGRPKRTRKS